MRTFWTSCSRFVGQFSLSSKNAVHKYHRYAPVCQGTNVLWIISRCSALGVRVHTTIVDLRMKETELSEFIPFRVYCATFVEKCKSLPLPQYCVSSSKNSNFLDSHYCARCKGKFPNFFITDLCTLHYCINRNYTSHYCVFHITVQSVRIQLD